jgi:hypothetical protein
MMTILHVNGVIFLPDLCAVHACLLVIAGAVLSWLMRWFLPNHDEVY